MPPNVFTSMCMNSVSKYIIFMLIASTSLAWSMPKNMSVSSTHSSAPSCVSARKLDTASSVS